MIIGVLTANILRKCYKKADDTRKTKNQTTTARVENSNSGQELDGLRTSRVSIDLDAVDREPSANEVNDGAHPADDVPVWNSNSAEVAFVPGS